MNGEPITGNFYEKELQKLNKKESRIEKVLKRKGDKLYVKWKGYSNSFNSWIDKKDLILKWPITFLSRLEVLEEILMLKLIFYNYAAKIDLKNVTHVDTSSFALKTNLAKNWS